MEEIFSEASAMIQEGLNSVVENPSVVFLNILVFILMITIVRIFLWERVTNFIDQRQHALTQEFEQARLERETAQNLQEKAHKEYDLMKAETEDLKTKLTQDAYQKQEQLIESAKAEAQRRIEQAEKDIEFEILQANEDIRQSIKEIAFQAASKIVKREIDESMHQDIIDEILKESEQSL